MSMGMMPDTEKNDSTFIDLFTTAKSKTRQVLNPNTLVPETETEIDSKGIDYQLHMVSSNRFGRFVFSKEMLEGLCQDAYNYMEPERAEVFSGQVMRRVVAYGYSIDALSSQTMRDKDNSVSSAFHILTSKKTERKITLKEDVKSGIMDSIRGKNKRDTAEV